MISSPGCSERNQRPARSRGAQGHAVATYTMILYNNERGIAPAVILKTPVSPATEKAVAEVIGQAVYYNGQYANTVYHSTSSGKTTSSQSVWGGALPYLVSVESPYDKKAPGYKSVAAVSRKNFAKRVQTVYGIELDGDPSEWITVERDAPGGYVGTVEIGGYTRSQGGSFGTGTITGRSVREQLHFRSESVRTALRCSTTRRGTVSCLQPMATDMAWE